MEKHFDNILKNQIFTKISCNHDDHNSVRMSDVISSVHEITSNSDYKKDYKNLDGRKTMAGYHRLNFEKYNSFGYTIDHEPNPYDNFKENFKKYKKTRQDFDLNYLSKMLYRKPLGTGHFSEVWKVKMTSNLSITSRSNALLFQGVDPTNFTACKRLKIKTKLTRREKVEDHLKDFISEVEILSKINEPGHENVLELKGIYLPEHLDEYKKSGHNDHDRDHNHFDTFSSSSVYSRSSDYCSDGKLGEFSKNNSLIILVISKKLAQFNSNSYFLPKIVIF